MRVRRCGGIDEPPRRGGGGVVLRRRAQDERQRTGFGGGERQSVEPDDEALAEAAVAVRLDCYAEGVGLPRPGCRRSGERRHGQLRLARGLQVEVALVEEGGDWKVDYIEGFADYDGKALGEAFEKQFEEEETELTPAQSKCIGGKIAALSQAEAEAIFFGGSADKIIELAQSCGK